MRFMVQEVKGVRRTVSAGPNCPPLNPHAVESMATFGEDVYFRDDVHFWEGCPLSRARRVPVSRAAQTAARTTA